MLIDKKVNLKKQVFLCLFFSQKLVKTITNILNIKLLIFQVLIVI